MLEHRIKEKIQLILDKYINMVNTKLRKSMNVEPVKLNMRDGSIPRAGLTMQDQGGVPGWQRRG